MEFGFNLIALVTGIIKLAITSLKNGEKVEDPRWYVDSLINCVFWKGRNEETCRDNVKLLIKYGLGLRENFEWSS